MHIAEARVEDLFLKVWKRYASSALLVAVVVVSILSLSQVQASLFTKCTVPTSGSNPEGYSVFVDGGLVYFTELDGNKISRLDPSTGVFNEYPIPTSGSGPEGIFVSGGLVYFTEYNGNKIGLFTFSPVATVTTSVSKTFSTVTTTSSVSTASSTFLSSTIVVSATRSTESVTASTTSVTSLLGDTLTVEATSTTTSETTTVAVGGEVYVPEQLHTFNISDILEPALNQSFGIIDRLRNLADIFITFEVYEVSIDKRVLNVLVTKNRHHV